MSSSQITYAKTTRLEKKDLQVKFKLHSDRTVAQATLLHCANFANAERSGVLSIVSIGAIVGA